MSTKIEWTRRVNPDGSISNGDTWNPLIGCDKVSAGCKSCYAIKTAWIRQHNPAMKEKYEGTVEKTPGGALNWTGKVNMHEPSLLKPLKQKKPTTYFVNSMSDLFHEAVPFEFIRKVYGVMAICDHHIFQILTKRPERMLEFFSWLGENYQDAGDDAYDLMTAAGMETGCGSAFEVETWPLPNVWLGVSCEDQKTADERIPLLLQVPAAVRFLSCEPLLGPIDLSSFNTLLSRICLGGKIDWLICGGESGPGARPMHPDWARSLRDQCKAAGVAYFFKQWGEYITEWHATPEMYDEIDSGDMKLSLPPNYYKVGKKRAGRLLDGVEYNEMPSL